LALGMSAAGAGGGLDTLGDAELFAVLLRLDAAALARASCVCQKWRKVAREGPLWERHCRQAKVFFERGEREGDWEGQGREGEGRGRDWWGVWRETPRLREDGVYVQRSWYMRRGLRDPRQPVPPSFRVVYHRYIRFFGDGTCWMVTSPESPYEVIRQLSAHHVAAARAAAKKAGSYRRGDSADADTSNRDSIRQGDWVLEGADLHVTLELGTQFLFLGFVLGQGGKPGSWGRLYPTEALDPSGAQPTSGRPWNRRDHGRHQYNESGPYCFFPIDGIDSPYPKPRVAPKPKPSSGSGEARPATAAGERTSCERPQSQPAAQES